MVPRSRPPASSVSNLSAAFFGFFVGKASSSSSSSSSSPSSSLSSLSLPVVSFPAVGLVALLFLRGRLLNSQLPLCTGILRRFCLPFLRWHGHFPLHIVRSLTILVIHNPKGNTTVDPVGLLIPIPTLIQASTMRQVEVELQLRLVVPISGSVCRWTKEVHEGIRLNGCNLTSHIWDVIDEGKQSR